MKLGLVSAILPEKNFEEVIDLAKRYGFQSVEMMCWPAGKAERRYAGITHIDVDNLTDKRSKEIIDYASTNGVEVSALSYYPNPLDPDLEKSSIAIAHIKKLIANAKRVNVSNVNAFVGRDHKKSLSENMVEFKRVWPDIIKLAEDHDVKVGIENCPMLFTEDEWPGGKNLATTPAIWEDMFSIIPSKHFGLNYDPSHFIWQQMDYIKPIYDFSEKIFHAHIKDIKIIKHKLSRVGIMAVPLAYSIPKLPGHGDVDWGQYISALEDIQFKGHVSIEIEDKAFEETLEDRLNAIALAKRYMNQFII